MKYLARAADDTNTTHAADDTNTTHAPGQKDDQFGVHRQAASLRLVNLSHELAGHMTHKATRAPGTVAELYLSIVQRPPRLLILQQVSARARP